MAVVLEDDASSTTFLSLVAELHFAELDASACEAAILSLLVKLEESARSAPEAWRSPFAHDGFCANTLLATCPAVFWRRLTRRFKSSERIGTAIGAISSLLAEEDLLDIAVPETVRIELSPEVSLTLQEGEYSTGGVGRFVYAAATALATLLVQSQAPSTRPRALPPREDDSIAAATTAAGTDKPASASSARPHSVQGLRVLELGCGLGLVGLAAARCGAASVLLTDHSDSSVRCAAANAALNGLEVIGQVRSASLDWNDFATAEGARKACEAAGLGVKVHAGGSEGGGEERWWPDVIVCADCCYMDGMGPPLLRTLSHILASSAPSARAYIINGWPNKGLAHFETLVGARAELAEHEARALAAGELSAAPRRYLDPLQIDEIAVPATRLRLLAVERLTGFAEHAHHLYAFSSSAAA
jgi:predicted nicotinamide N-methyase